MAEMKCENYRGELYQSRNLMKSEAGSAKKKRSVLSVRPLQPAKSIDSKRGRINSGESTILVVDDDTSTLRALKRLILAYGFHVETFSRPSELLCRKRLSSNACLIVDIHLPEMTGIEMYDELKRKGHNLPIILITGRTDRKTREAAAQSDAVAVLYKPFDEEPLFEAIERAIGMSRSRPT
jgi:FixJ family two-component response regulator